MKKSTFALSAISVLALATVGGSFITGKIAEEKFNHYIEKSNALLLAQSNAQFSAQIKDVTLDRHWFSSDISYTFSMKLNGDLFELKSNDILYHGPFPLNRLITGKLLPIAGSLESHLAPPDAFKNWVATPELTHSVINFGYNSRISGSTSLNPIKGENAQIALETAPFSVKFDVDQHFNGELDYQLPALKYRKLDTRDTLTIEGIEVKGNFIRNHQYAYLSDGHLKTKIKSLKQEDEHNSLTLQHLEYDTHAKLEQGRFISQNLLNVEVDLTLAEKTAKLGKFSQNAEMNLDAKAYDDLINTLITSGANGNISTNTDLAEKTQQLLATKPRINVKEWALANEKGKNTLALNVDLANSPLESKSTKEMLMSFKQSALTLSLNLPATEEFIKQIQTLKASKNAQQEAKESIEAFKREAQQSGLAKVSDNEIAVKLEIDNGEVKLNDRLVPEEDIEMAIFMIMMGMSGTRY